MVDLKSLKLELEEARRARIAAENGRPGARNLIEPDAGRADLAADRTGRGGGSCGLMAVCAVPLAVRVRNSPIR